MHPGDPVAQARAVFEIIGRALADGGFSLADVVRTRIYVTHRSSIEAVMAVHGQVFAEIRPAAAVVVVDELIDRSLLLEIEADAKRA